MATDYEDLDDIVACDSARFSGLGLIANPFVVPHDPEDDPAVASEIAAAGNVLLRELVRRASEEAPRPLLLVKGPRPAHFHLQAMASVESCLATDEGLGILYSYVPLFAMRMGAVRSTLNVIAERLAFRDFEQTLATFVDSVLAEPDQSLSTYTALPEGALDAFAERYAADARSAVRGVFGEETLELHPELAQVADFRQVTLSTDSPETDVSAELDASVGEAPGSAMVAAAAEERFEDTEKALFEYFAEYAGAHLSPVVARALRMNRDRGLAALASELTVTKAPRKTLTAVLALAHGRFKSTALFYDGFDNWLDIPEEDRSAVMGVFTELRWKTSGLAFPVFMVAPGEAPEIEETFGGSGSVSWDFPGFTGMTQEPGALVTDVVEGWLAAASRDDTAPLTMADPVLAALAERAGSAMKPFITMAHAAVESAAERGVSALDGQALDAGLAARA